MSEHPTIDGCGPKRPSTFVYCIWNPSRNTAKIGYTENLERRFQQLQTACSDRLIPWAYYPGDRVTEQVWHEALTNCGLKKVGEWFDASDGMILKGFLETSLRQGGKDWWR
ncbi:GIY-YIG nuclease family protein [uncultured Nitratireductor sp.]|uniref:GIY-YIG nuclease family protein n=1 Tax=uncultured Nitratireductor sp. TaxID=520953 RepID=UPI003455619D